MRTVRGPAVSTGGLYALPVTANVNNSAVEPSLRMVEPELLYMLNGSFKMHESDLSEYCELMA